MISFQILKTLSQWMQLKAKIFENFDFFTDFKGSFLTIETIL